MMPSKDDLLTASMIIAILVLRGVGATVVTTCQAAANSDKLFNYKFCLSELSKSRESPDADIWGLAKVAAMVGAGNADTTMANIKALLAKPGTDEKNRGLWDSASSCTTVWVMHL
ncbi:hypothetical protein ACP4OV_005827 [Aristida adscensionis]